MRNNKTQFQHIALHWRKILIGLITTLVAACGGSGANSTNTTENTQQAGVIAPRGMGGTANVGQTYIGQVDVVPEDTTLTVTSLSITNNTAGGAQPSIDNSGNVTWVPNEIDFSTNKSSLLIVGKLSNGAELSGSVAMDVRKTKQVLKVTLSADEKTYADTEGRYVFDISKETSASTITGELTITEKYRKNGEFTWSTDATGSGYIITVIQAPQTHLSSLEKNSTLVVQTGLVSSSPHPINQITAGDSDFPNISEKGSYLVEGTNVYSSRPAGYVYYKTKTENEVSVTKPSALPGINVFWFGSNCVAATNCRDLANNKSPVILIHGFSGTDNLGWSSIAGGNEATWGNTAKALTEQGNPVFEMRWFTYMPFEDAAGALANFGKSVAKLTGKKPIILAHSFGGVVSHLTLQNKGRKWNAISQGRGAWERVNTDGVFAKLITLNSPLSGINADGGYAAGSTAFNSAKKIYNSSGQLVDVNFPRGVDVNDGMIYKCYSITCAQAGAVFNDNVSFNQIAANKALIDGVTPILNIPITWGSLVDKYKIIGGVDRILKEGETIADIQTGIAQGTNNAPFLTVTGARTRDAFGKYNGSYTYGDGLISLLGQAAIPQDFSDDPFVASNPASYKFKFEHNEYSTLQSSNINLKFQNLQKGDCIKYSAGSREYLICSDSAHTVSNNICKVDYNSKLVEEGLTGCGLQERITNPIAHYSGVNTSNEVLPRLVFGNKYLNAEPTLFNPALSVLINSKIKGRVGASSGPTQVALISSAASLTPVKTRVWVTVLDKTTGVPKHYYIGAETDADGAFNIDIGAMIASKFPDNAVLDNYSVTLKIDTAGYKSWVKTIDSLSELIDVGEIDLSPQSSILTSITPTSATVNVATTFTVSGSNLPATATMEIQGATCQPAKLNSATGFTQVCTLRGAAGDKVATVKTDTTTNSGTVIDASKTINLIAPVNAASLSLTMDKASLTALGAQEIGVVNYIVGKDGRPAIKLGGTASPAAVRIPNSAAMQFTDGATFDMWVRLDSMTGMNGNGNVVSDGASYVMALLAKSSDWNGGAVFISGLTTGVAGGGPFWGGVDRSGCTVTAYTPVPLGTWVRVTVVMSTTAGAQSYLNGQKLWSCTGNVNFARMNTQDLYIGRFSDFWYPVNGAMQEINIYKKALTAAEVQALP